MPSPRSIHRLHQKLKQFLSLISRMEIFTKTFLLFLVLLNPFAMSIYLLEVIKTFDFFIFHI